MLIHSPCTWKHSVKLLASWRKLTGLPGDQSTCTGPYEGLLPFTSPWPPNPGFFMRGRRKGNVKVQGFRNCLRVLPLPHCTYKAKITLGKVRVRNDLFKEPDTEISVPRSQQLPAELTSSPTHRPSNCVPPWCTLSLHTCAQCHKLISAIAHTWAHSCTLRLEEDAQP